MAGNGPLLSDDVVPFILDFVTIDETGRSYVDRHGLEHTRARFAAFPPSLFSIDFAGATAHYTIRPLADQALPPLYRGAKPDRAIGLSWTPSLANAVEFAGKRDGEVWTAAFDPSDLLAVIEINECGVPLPPEWIMRPPLEPVPLGLEVQTVTAAELAVMRGLVRVP